MEGVKVLREDNSVVDKAKQEAKCSELDKAILDVEKGKVVNFDTLKEMMDYLES